MPAGGMLFQIKEDESVELVVKIHMQRPIAPGFKRWAFFQDLFKGRFSFLNETVEYFALVDGNRGIFITP
jgi:hypothetical protein